MIMAAMLGPKVKRWLSMRKGGFRFGDKRGTEASSEGKYLDNVVRARLALSRLLKFLSDVDVGRLERKMMETGDGELLDILQGGDRQEA
jgi:hypothetical protein